MEFDTGVPTEQLASEFYLPGTTKQSSECGRFERALRKRLPEAVLTATTPATKYELGFYLPGVKTPDRNE